jgi:hypothetical protein
MAPLKRSSPRKIYSPRRRGVQLPFGAALNFLTRDMAPWRRGMNRVWERSSKSKAAPPPALDAPHGPERLWQPARGRSSGRGGVLLRRQDDIARARRQDARMD